MAKRTRLHSLACEHYRSGSLSRAGSLCKRILKNEPENTEVLHLLGAVLGQAGQFEAAASFIGRAIQLGGPVPGWCANLGRALIGLGRPADAAACFRQALAAAPLDARVAAELGAALSQCGERDAAVLAHQHAAELEPAQAGHWFHLGNALCAVERFPEAGEAYGRALQSRPSHAETHHNLGVVRMLQGRRAEAEQCFSRAVQERPDYAEAQNNLGLLQHASGRRAEAEQRYRAASGSGFYAPAAHNLARLLFDQGRLEQSAAAYREVAERHPDHRDAQLGLGNVLVGLGESRDALERYRRAVALEPQSAEARFNLALALLQLGEWTEGWPAHEWRLKQRNSGRRDFDRPQWDGSPLEGRRILLHAEQGLGDTLQFCRWAPMVADRGGRVIVESQAAVAPLLASLDGVRAVVSRGEALPDFDCHAPLMSLPAIFRATPETLPDADPYLLADAELVGQWTRRLAAAARPSRLRVGLTWAGNSGHRNDANRSLRPAQLDLLPARPEIAYFSLQKNAAARPGLPVTDVSEHLTDFAQTAAAILNLDLVISADTAVAHLAGALGKPVWTLLPHAADWRWMLDRDDTPWYASMRLFRQPSRGDWESVIGRAGAELEKLVGA